MSGPYAIAGFLIGVFACRANSAEPGWGALLGVAVLAILVGWWMQDDQKGR